MKLLQTQLLNVLYPAVLNLPHHLTKSSSVAIISSDLLSKFPLDVLSNYLTTAYSSHSPSQTATELGLLNNPSPPTLLPILENETLFLSN